MVTTSLTAALLLAAPLSLSFSETRLIGIVAVVALAILRPLLAVSVVGLAVVSGAVYLIIRRSNFHAS